MSRFAGADWLRRNLEYSKPENCELSPLGAAVADLLGELYCGLYHIDDKHLMKVDWQNNHHIEITIGWGDWSTIDFDKLTKLVLLCHHTAIRVSLNPVAYSYLRLLFHQRRRVGSVSERHPTIDEAVENFRKYVSLPEYKEDGDG